MPFSLFTRKFLMLLLDIQLQHLIVTFQCLTLTVIWSKLLDSISRSTQPLNFVKLRSFRLLVYLASLRSTNLWTMTCFWPTLAFLYLKLGWSPQYLLVKIKYFFTGRHFVASFAQCFNTSCIVCIATIFSGIKKWIKLDSVDALNSLDVLSIRPL